MDLNNAKNPLTNKNIYTVPEGYFEALEHNIRQRTEAPASSAFRLSPFTLKLAGVAAMVTIAAWLFFPEPTVGTSPEDLLAAVSDEHLEAYLTETSGPDAEDILLPGSLSDETEINAYLETDTLF
ncbi:MAG: hypothetical protein ACKORJ_03685 [Bacteroidota bacterium]